MTRADAGDGGRKSCRHDYGGQGVARNAATDCRNITTVCSGAAAPDRRNHRSPGRGSTARAAGVMVSEQRGFRFILTCAAAAVVLIGYKEIK